MIFAMPISHSDRLRHHRSAFLVAWDRHPKDQTFVDFLDEVLVIAKVEGSAAVEVYACVASLMFVTGLDEDPLRAEILAVAGDLESGHPTSARHTPEYLEALVEELRPEPVR
jgi:hypothetical protein